MITRVRETRNQKSAIKILPGHVARVRIRCGKPNCKCARGERHIAFYYVTYADGLRSRRYVRKSEVSQVKLACRAHRKFQSELLEGRRAYSLLMRRVKDLFGGVL
jgi:hypothetical protein